MPRVCTIWQKAVELPIWKVNEVVHGVQGAELVFALLSSVPVFNTIHVLKGKKIMQRRLESLALTRRYVVCRVRVGAREHFLAELGEGGVVGRMGRVDDKGTTSFECVEGGYMSKSGTYHS